MFLYSINGCIPINTSRLFYLNREIEVHENADCEPNFKEGDTASTVSPQKQAAIRTAGLVLRSYAKSYAPYKGLLLTQTAFYPYFLLLQLEEMG